MGDRNDINVKGRATDAPTLSSSTDKPDGTVALVKSGGEKVKTTPAGEYLTSALNEFDPDQYDSLAAISDGANKLLMLVRSYPPFALWYSRLSRVLLKYQVFKQQF